MDILKVLLTSLISVAALFIIAKIMGHKQLAQLDFFDYISGITIGSIAAELATQLEEPLMPLTALVVYGIVSVTLGWIAHTYPKTRKFSNGTPTIIMDGGKLYRKNLKKAKLDLSEFMVLCREQGYFDLQEIQTAIFETNGQLTVLPVSLHRPATPDDLGLQPKPAHIYTELIMDGRILDENLQRRGFDRRWLEKQLKVQGYHCAEEIFLGICDDEGQLQLYPIQ